MTKSELIQLIEKKIVEQKEFMEMASPLNPAQHALCMQAISQYSWFIEKIKNLNGETVKLREVCPACEGKKVIIFNNVISECEFCKP